MANESSPDVPSVNPALAPQPAPGVMPMNVPPGEITKHQVSAVPAPANPTPKQEKKAAGKEGADK